MDLLALFDGLDPPVTRVEFIDALSGEHYPVHGRAIVVRSGGKRTAQGWLPSKLKTIEEEIADAAVIMRQAHEKEFHGGGCEKGVWNNV